MEFRKFCQIENSYNEKILSTFREQIDPSEIWCVLEKVHGANFSFTTDGKTVKYGKRSSFLGADGLKYFNNCEEICKQTEPQIISIFNMLKSQMLVETITVYGELFGGGYSGVKKYPDCKLVQKGVEYYHKHGFYAFDIGITYNSQFKYLNYDEAVKLFEQYNIFHARILFSGTLDECLEYSHSTYEDLTEIPKLLYADDYKEIPGNVREGNVIKPIIHHYTKAGSSIILKEKNDKFKEKTNRKSPINTDEYKALTDLIKSYITKNRLDNYISKEGPITKENLGSYIGGLYKDSIADFKKENPDQLLLFDKYKQKLAKVLSNKCRDLVLNEFKPETDL